MKRFLFLFIFSFALYCSSQRSIVPTLTEAWGVVQKQLSLSANRHIEVLAKTSLIEANSSIKAMNTIMGTSQS